MDLEFHQLELRYESLRSREPEREKRLLASLSERGQQVPIAVVSIEAPRYAVIDGYKRGARAAPAARGRGGGNTVGPRGVGRTDPRPTAACQRTGQRTGGGLAAVRAAAALRSPLRSWRADSTVARAG